MRRHIFNLLLFVALILQGVAAVGGGMPADHGQEQHCAGHEAMQADCPCCPDGGAASMNCTVQCTVSQAPLVLLTPVRLASYSTSTLFIQPVFVGPSYAPLVPPPIV
jgi:hypothetical protein